MKLFSETIIIAFLSSIVLYGQDNDNTLQEIWRSTDDVFGTGWITNTNLDLDKDGLKEMILWWMFHRLGLKNMLQ